MLCATLACSPSQTGSRTTATIENALGRTETSEGGGQAVSAAVQAGQPEALPEHDEKAYEPPLPPADSPEFHRAVGVVDLHADTLHRLHKHSAHFETFPRAEFSPRLAKQGSVVAQFFALWVDPEDENAWQTLNSELQIFTRQVVAHSDFELARSFGDVARIQAKGKIAAFLSLEGASSLEGRLQRFDSLIEKGVRLASLTWNEDNAFATGAKTKGRKGLTWKGKKLVARMEEAGIAIDISHASNHTFWDIYTRTKSPLWASHSNAASVRAHPRNLDDTQLWAIRDSGGVVGLNFHSTFLRSKGRATITDVVKHALHMRRVMGASHIALGSDFDGSIRAPTGLEHVGRVPRLTRALAQAGFRIDELQGLLASNALRVLANVEEKKAGKGPRYRPARWIPAGPRPRGLSNAGRRSLFDRNVLTEWRREKPLEKPMPLRFKTTQRGIERVSFCASQWKGPPPELTVHAAGREIHRQLLPSPRECPTRIALPAARCERHLTLEINFPRGWTGRVAEILPERRVVDCSLEK